MKRRKNRTGKEFRLDAQVHGYYVKDIILDLGYNVNILPNQFWEAVVKPQLVFSPIQLRMANQYRIFPIGRLQNVEVYLAGVMTTTDFKVLSIMDDKDPYRALLGIEWAFDNYAVIDLKK